ncbi:MAG: hypothetical protein LBO09_05715 [Candidatus Peribacteria bacterium]|nr:hypothetical protein [Candidatus Peribacteria bacterium]
MKYLNYGEKIVDIKYFTAYPLKDPEGNKRLKQYLQALDRRGIKIILGKYQEIKKSFSRKHNYIIYTYRNRFTDLVINQFYKPF